MCRSGLISSWEGKLHAYVLIGHYFDVIQIIDMGQILIVDTPIEFLEKFRILIIRVRNLSGVNVAKVGGYIGRRRLEQCL